MSKKPVKEVIHAKGFDISIYTEDFQNEFISLTDIARYKSDEPFIVINNWMRGKDTIEFLGLWEQLHNPEFKPIEFDRFRKEAGYNAFTLSPQKWIANTNAIGIVSKSGRYGGTFAHSDIAFEFASWISAEFIPGSVPGSPSEVAEVVHKRIQIYQGFQRTPLKKRGNMYLVKSKKFRKLI